MLSNAEYSMKTLYPEIDSYHSFELAVGDGHTLYVEESGNPEGVPVVFLHGGPGAGCEPWQRRFFNPQQYRIVLFDQRGCGRSRPCASLVHNTTQALVADIEKIRHTLTIDRWVVFGGSWGSTLGLVYAQKHAEQCLGLVLRGIFLCRDEDIQWFYQSGANYLFPDLWEDFQRPIPVAERGDMVSAYYQRLIGDDQATQLEAARAWSLWEGKTLTLIAEDDVIDYFANPRIALSLARIECHYFINHIFMQPGEILANVGRLKEIPSVIVHGRYDVVCPVAQAYVLHQHWPEAELTIVPNAGHAANEVGIIHHLVNATDALANRYRQ